MIWARTSRSRRRLCSASFTETTVSGSLTLSAAAIRADLPRCAQIMELKWNRRFLRCRLVYKKVRR